MSKDTIIRDLQKLLYGDENTTLASLALGGVPVLIIMPTRPYWDYLNALGPGLPDFDRWDPCTFKVIQPIHFDGVRVIFSPDIEEIILIRS